MKLFHKTAKTRTFVANVKTTDEAYTAVIMDCLKKGYATAYCRVVEEEKIHIYDIGSYSEFYELEVV